jgi:hypothetical protein
MDTIKFSVVENCKLTSVVCNEIELIKGLTGDKMKSRIEPIRKLLAEGEKDKANQLKSKLPAITLSGIFKGRRTADKLDEYSHIVCLDLDKLAPDKLLPLKDLIAGCCYTLAVFISPSGNGLKIMVKISSGSNYHRDAYRQVLKYYTELTGERFDEVTSDISRLMFMSYDPEVYHYPDSDVFPVVTPINIELPKAESKLVSMGAADASLFDEIYEAALKFTTSKQEYKEGKRNNFIYCLAASCNRYGLPIEELRSKLDWCELSETEIKSALNSAYKNREQYGTWQLPNKHKPFNAVEADPGTTIAEPVSVLLEPEIKYKAPSENRLAVAIPDMAEKNDCISPTLPEDVYNLLPDFLKGITSHFSDAIEKDLVLLSSLGVLSSAFPKTKGLYRRSSKSLNLFELFVAPPSSGKGQMNRAEDLGKEIDKYLQQKYKMEYRAYKEAGGAESGAEEPKEKKFFIGADSSNIALASQMHSNENIGVMFDSEGSTLAQMFKNDWSNCKNILLRAFENESLSISRKKKTDSFTIDKTFLSLVLSTTPNQLVSIIGDIESGLYSRFLIYFFRSEVVWKDHFSEEGDSLDPVFEEAAREVLRMYKANEEGPAITIFLSDEQRKEIFNYFSKRLTEFHSEYDHELLANVKRTCVMYYKIAMILTVLRSYQNADVLPEKLIIDNRDHRAASLIVDTLLEHVKVVYETSLQEQTNGSITGMKKLLADSLPVQNFQKTQYLEISKKLGIKKPTAEKWLTDLQKVGRIIKLDRGLYRKAA